MNIVIEESPLVGRIVNSGSNGLELTRIELLHVLPHIESDLAYAFDMHSYMNMEYELFRVSYIHGKFAIVAVEGSERN